MGQESNRGYKLVVGVQMVGVEAEAVVVVSEGKLKWELAEVMEKEEHKMVEEEVRMEEEVVVVEEIRVGEVVVEGEVVEAEVVEEGEVVETGEAVGA